MLLRLNSFRYTLELHLTIKKNTHTHPHNDHFPANASSSHHYFRNTNNKLLCNSYNVYLIIITLNICLCLKYEVYPNIVIVFQSNI